MRETSEVTKVGGWMVAAPCAGMPETYRIQITCDDDILYLLRCARALCMGGGHGRRRLIQGSTAVVVVRELARNILKHSNGGSVSLTLWPDDALHIVAQDSGPGIERPSAVLSHSLGGHGRAGSGLGIAQRAASSFELRTSARGTRVTVTIEQEADSSPRAGFEQWA